MGVGVDSNVIDKKLTNYRMYYIPMSILAFLIIVVTTLNNTSSHLLLAQSS